MASLHPDYLWAEDMEMVHLTFKVREVDVNVLDVHVEERDVPTVELPPKDGDMEGAAAEPKKAYCVKFKTESPFNRKTYECTIDLRGEVEPELAWLQVSKMNVYIQLRKKNPSHGKWDGLRPRGTRKPKYEKVDWDKANLDDSDDEREAKKLEEIRKKKEAEEAERAKNYVNLDKVRKYIKRQEKKEAKAKAYFDVLGEGTVDGFDEYPVDPLKVAEEKEAEEKKAKEAANSVASLEAKVKAGNTGTATAEAEAKAEENA